MKLNCDSDMSELQNILNEFNDYEKHLQRATSEKTIQQQIEEEMMEESSSDDERKQQNFFINYTQTQKQQIANSQKDVLETKRNVERQYIELLKPSDQIKGLYIPIQNTRDKMYDTKDIKSYIKTKQGDALPFFSVDNDFLLSGVKLPAQVKPGKTLSETNKVIKQRSFWLEQMKAKTQEVIQQGQQLQQDEQIVRRSNLKNSINNSQQFNDQKTVIVL